MHVCFAQLQLGCVVVDAPIPLNVLLAITYATFVKGDQANFEINAASGVEASELYPEVKNTTVEEYLDQIAV